MKVCWRGYLGKRGLCEQRRCLTLDHHDRLTLTIQNGQVQIGDHLFPMIHVHVRYQQMMDMCSILRRLQIHAKAATVLQSCNIKANAHPELPSSKPFQAGSDDAYPSLWSHCKLVTSAAAH